MSISIDGSGSITGIDQGLSVSGVLTFDDVTNVDSVGLVTARSGLHVTGGDVGIGTDTNLTAKLTVGNIENTGVTNKGASAFKTLNSSGGVGEAAIYLEEQSGSEGWYLKVNSSGDLQFNDSGVADRITFQDDGNVGIGEDSPDHKLHVQGDIGLRDHAVVGTANNVTTTSTTQTAVASISASTHRSVEFLVQATEGTNYHVIKVLVIHDGTTAYNTQYGEMFTNTSVFSLDADISGGNIRLLGTSASANSTVYKISFQSIKV